MTDSDKNGENVDGAATRKEGKKKEKKSKAGEVVQVTISLIIFRDIYSDKINLRLYNV